MASLPLLSHARPVKSVIIRNILIIFKEANCLTCPTLSERDKQAIRFISVEKGWGGGVKGGEGEGARKRDVCCILSNLSSWC